AKCPLDLWVYHDILAEVRPDIVIETGTFLGGSALFMASCMDTLGHGRVITIDIEDHPERPSHPRITYLVGSSTDSAVTESHPSARRGRGSRDGRSRLRPSPRPRPGRAPHVLGARHAGLVSHRRGHEHQRPSGLDAFRRGAAGSRRGISRR